MPEDVGFYSHLVTVRENLMFTARLNSTSGAMWQSRKVEQFLARVGLTEAAEEKDRESIHAECCSGLGLRMFLIKNPEVIILDEPTLGIDPTGVKEFLELIEELSRAEGLTVLFSSHDLHHVQQVCDRVGLFVNGKLLAEGNISSLSKKLFSKSPLRCRSLHYAG